MHDAFECVTILERLPLEIDCIASSGQTLFVGTTKGHLLVYKIQVDASSSKNGKTKFEVELLRSNKAFGRKPILQLVALKEYDILVSLSDGCINVHDFFEPNNTPNNYNHKQNFPRSKGITYFSIDPTTINDPDHPLRLCAISKRKLHTFYWQRGKFVEMYNELTLPDTPKVAVWMGDYICFAMKKEYSLMKADTGALTNLFDVGSRKMEPLMVPMPGGELAVCRDEVTIFLTLDEKGEHKQKHAVTWSDIPQDLAFFDPYIIAILPKHIEICSRSPQECVQRVSVNAAKRINRGPHCYASSISHVWRLVPIPFTKQIEELKKEKEYEMALELCKFLDDKELSQKIIPQIKKLHAFELFCSKRFELALKLFKEIDVEPTFVIGLFPDLLPEQYRKQIQYPAQVPKMTSGDLQKGFHCLTEYLTRIRNKSLSEANNKEANISPTSDQPRKMLLQIIDTSLLKCYMQTNENMIAPLLRLKDNHCHVEECERVLAKAKKVNELVLLYQSKGNHKKALDLLLRQSDMPTSQLNGPRKTVDYLQHMGADHVQLVLDYSKWVLKKYPEDGLKIFTADTPEVESLPRDKVLSHLEAITPQLVISYLEHIINDWKDGHPEFHNRLIIFYKDKILPLLREEMVAPSDDPEEGELATMRTKLLFFLETSTNYQPYKLLRFFPQDVLFEERALLLGRSGRHEEALAIYIYVLKNNKMAEKYCRRQYEQNEEENRNVYLSLVKMYLNPQELPSLGLPQSTFSDVELEPKTKEALDILNKYNKKIDITQTLELLPQTTEVQDIRTFLMRVLKEKIQQRRSSMVLKSLFYRDHLQVHEQRIYYQSTKCVITEERACRVCHKRIGTSAFAMYPNGVIVHYYCCKDRRICPVDPDA